MNEKVILVDENDNELGLMEKMEAHELGKLHRAFSVFVFDNTKRLLLQKRASHKYHSPGLWTNTCCSHPRSGESTLQAAKRRLHEEMGFSCDIVYAFDFIYKADMGNGLTEHEFDYVFFGTYTGEPKINTEEVEDWRYSSLQEIEDDMKKHPENYTAWFKIAFDRVKAFHS